MDLLQEYLARAQAAEAECKRLTDALATLETIANSKMEAMQRVTDEAIETVQRRLDDRATLITIIRDGRKVRFMFMRNKSIIPVEFLGTWDDDVDGWKAALLEEPNNEGQT